MQEPERQAPLAPGLVWISRIVRRVALDANTAVGAGFCSIFEPRGSGLSELYILYAPMLACVMLHVNRDTSVKMWDIEFRLLSNHDLCESTRSLPTQDQDRLASSVISAPVESHS